MDLSKTFMNELVIVRTEKAGVFVGILLGRSDTTVLLGDCLRVHFWKGANTLSEMSLSGVDEGARLSEKVESQLVFGAKEILPVREIAAKRLVPQWT